MVAYAWPRIDWDALRSKRRERLRDLMRDMRLDHLLLSSFDNVRYATDYRTNLTYDSNCEFFAALVDQSGDSTLIVFDTEFDEDAPLADFPWIKRRVAGPSWQPFWARAAAYTGVLARELSALGAKRVGVDVLQFDVVDRLRKDLSGVEYLPVGEELLRLRRVKMPEEVSLLEASCEVASLCMSAVMRGTHEGVTDEELAALAVETAYHHGVEWLSHCALVAQGNPREVNWLPRGRRLWDGESFLLDFGVYGVGGYCSDFCRTVFVGEPRPEVATAHKALIAAFQEGVDLARPGVPCSDIARAICDGLQARGLPETDYAMGHGIGLRLTEPPSISKAGLVDVEEQLVEGMVICIEPSTVVELDGVPVSLKEEEQYVVESAGLRQLTRSRRAQG